MPPRPMPRFRRYRRRCWNPRRRCRDHRRRCHNHRRRCFRRRYRHALPPLFLALGRLGRSIRSGSTTIGLRSKRCSDSERLTPAPPRGTKATKSMASRVSSMVWARAEIPTVSPTYPCTAALRIDAGRPPQIIGHSQAVALLNDVTAWAVPIFFVCFPSVVEGSSARPSPKRIRPTPGAFGLS